MQRRSALFFVVAGFLVLPVGPASGMVCDGLKTDSVAYQMCVRGKYFGFAFGAPPAASDVYSLEATIFTPEAVFWESVQKKPYRGYDLPDDGSTDFLCDAWTTATGNCNADTAIFDFRDVNTFVDRAQQLRKDLHWGSHIFWPWLGNPYFGDSYLYSHTDVKAWAFYLVRHVVKRVAWRAGSAPKIRVSFNVTNEVVCRAFPFGVFQCGRDAQRDNAERDGSYTYLRMTGLRFPGTRPQTNLLEGSTTIRAAFKGAYDGAAAAGDPGLQRTKFYVNHFDLESSSVRKAGSPEPYTRYYVRVGVRDLIKMIQADFGWGNRWGYPVVPNIVWGVGNQGHYLDADRILDPSTGECGGWSNGTPIVWGGEGNPGDPEHRAWNYEQRCFVESLQGVFASFAWPYLSRTLKVLYTEVDVDKAGLYRMGAGYRKVQGTAGVVYIPVGYDDTLFPCYDLGNGTCVWTNRITGVRVTYPSDPWIHQRNFWRRLGRVCAAHSQCEGIITWGTSDDTSWLSTWRESMNATGPGSRPDPARYPSGYGMIVYCPKGDGTCRAPLLFYPGAVRKATYHQLLAGIGSVPRPWSRFRPRRLFGTPPSRASRPFQTPPSRGIPAPER